MHPRLEDGSGSCRPLVRRPRSHGRSSSHGLSGEWSRAEGARRAKRLQDRWDLGGAKTLLVHSPRKHTAGSWVRVVMIESLSLTVNMRSTGQSEQVYRSASSEKKLCCLSLGLGSTNYAHASVVGEGAACSSLRYLLIDHTCMK